MNIMCCFIFKCIIIFSFILNLHIVICIFVVCFWICSFIIFAKALWISWISIVFIVDKVSDVSLLLLSSQLSITSSTSSLLCLHYCCTACPLLCLIYRCLSSLSTAVCTPALTPISTEFVYCILWVLIVGGEIELDVSILIIVIVIVSMNRVLFRQNLIIFSIRFCTWNEYLPIKYRDIYFIIESPVKFLLVWDAILDWCFLNYFPNQIRSSTSIFQAIITYQSLWTLSGIW